MPWIPFLVISGVSTLILVVMVVALARHVKLLAATLGQFQREVEPVLGELRAGAEQAQQRLESAAASAQELQRAAEPGGPR